MTKNTLLLTLPQQAFAIVGDIHGEYQALDKLLAHLEQNPACKNRMIVFIGDLCDRGPDSVNTILRVQKLVEEGKALCILGNHEINLLANDAKDGSGWFFDSRVQTDTPFYAPFERASAIQRPAIREFLCNLPLAIQTPDLRLVHAAWDPESISKIARIPQGSILGLIHETSLEIEKAAAKDDLHARYLAELERWASRLEDPDNPPPYLDAVADYESLDQQLNPIKRLTCGLEERSPHPFFSGNRWRYSDRTPWWNNDTDSRAVVMGHYWRLYHAPRPGEAWRYSHLFRDTPPTAWHGLKRQAFCIDYSVGARWRERKSGHHMAASKYRLAALLWPEKQLIFDDGSQESTLENT